MPFDFCQKSQEQNDIDFLVRGGSNIEKSKLRILAYYQLNEPSTADFAKFLQQEYGTGGWSDGKRSESHSPKGISINILGRNYSYKWNEFARLVAKSIDQDEYVSEKDLPKPEYYSVKSEENAPFNYLRKTFHFCETYGGRKMIVAHLSSVTDEEVKNVRFFKNIGNVNDHVDIGIHEILDAVESGCYESTDEIWTDIKRSGRRVNPTAFGGKKWLDEEAIEDYLKAYKKTGYAHGRKLSYPYCYPRLDETRSFYHTRLRVKRGELSSVYLRDRSEWGVDEE